MFASLKLKNRILLGYTIPLALFIGLVVPILSTARQVTETSRQTKISMTAIKGSDDMNISLSHMGYYYRGYLLKQTDNELNKYQENLENFRRASQQVGDVIENPEQKQRLQQMVDLSNQYDAIVQSRFTMIKQGKLSDVMKLIRLGKGAKIIENFAQLNQDFTKKEDQILSDANIKSDANVSFLVAAVLVGAVLGIIVALFAAFLISSGIAQRIGQAIAAIARSSTQIATTAEEQERIATQQAASVSQTTTTMDELGASSRISAEQAEAAAAGARQVLALVDGNNYTDSLNGFAGSSLREKVGQISEQILRLSTQTQQIGSISTLVSDLANQTNMLALNAAVEAVRAGEHGKGFGVVASEIRRLADESKKSAERINALVVDIQNATNSTAMATDDGRKTVENVVEAINNIAVNTQQISLTAKQQSIAIQQVVDAMNALKQGASQTASGISQTKVGTQKLNDAAQNLKTIV